MVGGLKDKGQEEKAGKINNRDQRYSPPGLGVLVGKQNQENDEDWFWPFQQNPGPDPSNN